MQAGLSWITVLKKRKNFRRAFDNFNPQKMAEYDEQKISALLEDAGIIRNRLKIEAAIKNAQAFLMFAQRSESFSDYLWSFVQGKPIQNSWQCHAEIPAKTVISDQLSKSLVKLGFKFVGSTICYAFMQAAGMVNDHVVTCFKHQKLKNSTAIPAVNC